MKEPEKVRWARKLLRKQGAYPEQVFFFVTARCSLRCRHCFYWRDIEAAETGAGEATIEEIRRVSATMQPFSLLTLTGGEPFLREDLAEIAGTFHENNGVRRIHIPTNGLDTDAVITLTTAVLANCPTVDLVVKVSLDGLEATHDRIRGRTGSFGAALRTIAALNQLKFSHRRLRVGVIMCHSRLNEEELPALLPLIRTQLHPDMIGVTLVRGEPADPHAAAPDFEGFVHLYRMALADEPADSLTVALRRRFRRAYKQRLVEMMTVLHRDARAHYPCYAGRLFCVIEPDLRVRACELLAGDMGSLRDFQYDFAALWSSSRAAAVRNHIKQHGCRCSHECMLQITSMFDPRQLIHVLSRCLYGGPP